MKKLQLLLVMWALIGSLYAPTPRSPRASTREQKSTPGCFSWFRSKKRVLPVDNSVAGGDDRSGVTLRRSDGPVPHTSRSGRYLVSSVHSGGGASSTSGTDTKKMVRSNARPDPLPRATSRASVSDLDATVAAASAQAQAHIAQLQKQQAREKKALKKDLAATRTTHNNIGDALSRDRRPSSVRREENESLEAEFKALQGAI